MPFGTLQRSATPSPKPLYQLAVKLSRTRSARFGFLRGHKAGAHPRGCLVNDAGVHVVHATFDHLCENIFKRQVLIDKDAFLEFFPVAGMLGERLFFVFDVDGNGKLERKDFLCGLACLWFPQEMGTRQQMIYDMFNLSDSKDGVSAEDLSIMIKACLLANGSLMAELGLMNEANEHAEATGDHPSVLTRPASDKPAPSTSGSLHLADDGASLDRDVSQMLLEHHRVDMDKLNDFVRQQVEGAFPLATPKTPATPLSASSSSNMGDRRRSSSNIGLVKSEERLNVAAFAAWLDKHAFVEQAVYDNPVVRKQKARLKELCGFADRPLPLSPSTSGKTSPDDSDRLSPTSSSFLGRRTPFAPRATDESASFAAPARPATPPLVAPTPVQRTSTPPPHRGYTQSPMHATPPPQAWRSSSASRMRQPSDGMDTPNEHFEIEGPLHKYGQTLHLYTKRYYAIRDGFLLKWKSKPIAHERPVDVIFIEHAYVEDFIDKADADSNNDGVYGIRIHTNNFHWSFELYADSKEDQQEWMQALLKTCKRRRFEDRFVFGDRIGSGTYALVHKAFDKKTGQLYAVKVIDKSNLSIEELQNLESEVATHMQCSHKNIAKVYDLFETPSELHLVMEYLDRGELRKLIENGPLPERAARDVIRQVVDGVAHLHELGIIHRDLKPNNIGISGDNDNIQAKILDFGYSKYIRPNQKMTDVVGTRKYFAPELLRHQSYGKPVDVWCIGVLAYTVLTGLYPFVGEDSDEAMSNAEKANFSVMDEAWKSLPKSAKDFVRALLKQDPAARPSIQEVRKLPWLSGLRVPSDGSSMTTGLRSARSLTEERLSSSNPGSPRSSVVYD